MSRHALVHDLQHRGDLALHCALSLEDSRGRLRLAAADPTVPVTLDYGYLSEPRDRERLRYCIRFARELLEHRAFRELGIEVTGPTEAETANDSVLDHWLSVHMGTSAHTAGTCRMGSPGDPTAVVDDHCRVLGVDGLRVVDISIMPRLVRRATNASAVMIGERAAELFA
jgi:choline dehydrogenase-like flavoprotein